MKKKLLCLTALVLLAASACKKPSADGIPIVLTGYASPMLKTISWPGLGTSADLHYNADSTVQRISYTGSGNPSHTDYVYSKYGVTEIHNSNSLGRQFLSYDASGRLNLMKKTIKHGSTYREYARGAFTYNASGRLNTLKYYQVNEAGMSLTSTTLFEYDANGLPEKITTTDKNNINTVITIERYSDKFLFDPVYFLDAKMGDLGVIYNYSILGYLAKMRVLPASITVSSHTGSQNNLIKKIEVDFTISSQRLHKQTAITATTAPPSTQILEVNYAY